MREGGLIPGLCGRRGEGGGLTRRLRFVSGGGFDVRLSVTPVRPVISAVSGEMITLGHVCGTLGETKTLAQHRFTAGPTPEALRRQ